MRDACDGPDPDDADAGIPARPVLDHAPARPDRHGRLDEIAFLSGWQDLMAETEGAILDHDTRDGYVRATQADATLAASMMQWLGTNGGAGLVHEARRLSEAGLCGPDAFQAAWAIQNARRGHVNHGLRSLEWIMLPPGPEASALEPVPAGMPVLTVEQLEMAEHLVRWLGGPAGAGFLAAREAEIEACRKLEHSRSAAANRERRAAPPPMGAREILDLLGILRAAGRGRDVA